MLRFDWPVYFISLVTQHAKNLMTEQVTADFSKMSLLIELVTDLCFKTCDISFYAVF
jgi:hypothetical protein